MFIIVHNIPDYQLEEMYSFCVDEEDILHKKLGLSVNSNQFMICQFIYHKLYFRNVQTVVKSVHTPSKICKMLIILPK